MSNIQVLDEITINQIAAGEVVERPSAVVKELIENAIDAGANAITVEIKEGGLSLIRITDNGAGMAKEDIPLSFMRHATSKIRRAEDLLSVSSLGFRGEALSSIAAVSQVELITKTGEALSGYRYVIEGGTEKSFEEIGCPNGTTFLVRNLFYNTPARRKFLKSPSTEASYISDLMERIMVSHPDISFKFIVGNQVKLQSSGNNKSKDIIYNIYGRDISRELLPVSFVSEELTVEGYIGKPTVSRGNRNFENYFINGRYIKSSVISKAIEDAYKPFVMQHKYPFTSLYFTMDPMQIDVNVHPQKLELRLKNSNWVYDMTFQVIKAALTENEAIPRVTLSHSATEKKNAKQSIRPLPEPFEQNRRRQVHAMDQDINPLTKSQEVHEDPSAKSQEVHEDPSSKSQVVHVDSSRKSEQVHVDPSSKSPLVHEDSSEYNKKSTIQSKEAAISEEQLSLFETEQEQDSKNRFLSKEAFHDHRIIGQVFSTYWLIEYNKELYIIDQHAAHEKVLYEKILSAAKNKVHQSQQIFPPIVLTLGMREQAVLKKYKDILTQFGYEFEHFGGNEYSVRAVPSDLYGLSEKNLFIEFIDELTEDFSNKTPTAVLERIASLSCKAAVKANHTFSLEEATALISDLLTLENPYHCPHGRPVIISISQKELEKKFKRIVS